MKCRKCGHENAPAEWVCSRCEYILDPSFLGSDILNERTRDGIDDEPPAPLPPEEDFGGDALILGRLGAKDEQEEEAPQNFMTDRSNDFMPATSSLAPAAVYITAELRNLLMPFRILRPTEDAFARAEDVLSPFERSLFDLIDGMRTLEEVQQAAGLSDHELCVSVAMLCEKQLIEPIPSASAQRPQPHPTTLSVELDDSTRELEDLPPLATPALDSASPSAPVRKAHAPASVTPGMGSPFDNPLGKVPIATSVQAAPAPMPPSLARPALGVRPAMPAAPKLKPLPPSPPPAAPKGTAPPAPAPAPAPAQAPRADDKAAKAASYYDLCMKDLAAGRQGRAWSYARMALEAEPTNEKYQMLVHDWHRHQGGAHGERASTPQELMASAQAAENAGDYAAAIEFIKKVIAVAPGSAAAHNRLAVLLATRMHEYRAAYNAAIKAVELEPGNMAYQSNMMKILARVDNEKSAKDAKGSGSGSGSSGGGGLLSRLLKR